MTSVTRDGIVKAARTKTANFDNFRADRKQIPRGVLIAHASRFKTASTTVLASVDEEYRSPEAVKNALTPFLA